MSSSRQTEMVSRKYRDTFGAALQPAFTSWHGADINGKVAAALGYRRAGPEPLFLEAYLDAPIEQIASALLGKQVERASIVEIGNLASDNALATIELWGAAANDLGDESEVAVATLTAPLRRMFERIGLPIAVIAPARAERLGTGSASWGSYYLLDPQVCIGVIADGQRAIDAFLAGRNRKRAA